MAFSEIESAPSRPALVGLCSPAMGSGKSEVARILERRHGFRRVMFAETLKAMTVAFFEGAGLSHADALELITDRELKEAPLLLLNDRSPRHVMQTLGTEWGRAHVREDIWICMAMLRVERLMADGHSVVIDDVRFANEADAITRAGGCMVRVRRPGVAVAHSHASEGELDARPMLEIQNSGTLVELAASVNMLVGHVAENEILPASAPPA